MRQIIINTISFFEAKFIIEVTNYVQVPAVYVDPNKFSMCLYMFRRFLTGCHSCRYDLLKPDNTTMLYVIY